MDLIVAVCRALANRSRLRLLRVIHAKPGITVQRLADETGLAAPVTSKHLGVLRGFHLLAMAPRGRHVQCLPPQPASTSNKFLQEIQGLLVEWLGEKNLNRTRAKVCDSACGPGWDTAFGAMVKLFTAYTHLRRLLILRFLARNGASRLSDISASVGMSPDATYRHMDKLCRRGLVVATATDTGSWVLVATPSPPGRGRLLAVVLRALKGQ